MLDKLFLVLSLLSSLSIIRSFVWFLTDDLCDRVEAAPLSAATPAYAARTGEYTQEALNALKKNVISINMDRNKYVLPPLLELCYVLRHCSHLISCFSPYQPM